MIRFKRKIFLAILLGASIWTMLAIGVLVGTWLAAGDLAHALERKDLTEARRQLDSLDRYFSKGWHFTGLANLPYFSSVYKAGTAGTDWGQTIFITARQAEALANASFSGSEIDWAELQQFKSSITSIADKAAVFRQQLGKREIEIVAGLVGKRELVGKTIHTLETGLRYWDQYSPLLPRLDSLLGYESPKRYLVIFENNMELRPTGGFMGSFADLTIENGALKQLVIQDIYAPDGQIKGYVKEPEPIKDYLFRGETPGWRLRDSNWDPDFVRASRDMEWFFAEGGVGPIDGIIAITLEPILDMLSVIGPIAIPDYGLEVTSDTFYQQAQYQAEHGFFPGSTQKRDFLGSVGRQLLWKIEQGQPEDMAALLPVVAKNLEERQIMVSLFKPEDGQFFEEERFDGRLSPSGCPKDLPGCSLDFLHINEANVGITKANCCIERQFSDEITLSQSGEIRHQLSLWFKNNNPPTPQPPVQWGGGYKNYVRIVIPEKAQLEGVRINGQELTGDQIDLETEDGLQYVGFLILIEGTHTGGAEVTYRSAVTPNSEAPYVLEVFKQPGVKEIPWTVRTNGFTGAGLIRERAELKALPDTQFTTTKDFWVKLDLE